MGEPDLDELSAILIGPERQRLDELQTRLDDPEARARDVADVLPHILLQHAQDPHFTKALAPPIEKALTASIRRDPKPMADALFPVMGPAIRKAVAAALTGMVESLNRTLEHSFSWKSIQWRIEARRTGRSFGEFILLKTLVYRVEQVFLIDRRTGLLLQHIQHGEGEVQDADMVSGMLTAIRDFVHDSFKVSESESLEALKVGDLSVWVEPGPLAIVAAVIRGSAPREYRRTLQDAVESIHLQFAEPLEHFSGDASTLADARSTLEGCVEARFQPDEARPRSRGAWMLAGVVALALLVAGAFSWRAHARWTTYLAALRAEPGIVVVGSTREGGRYVVSGLRDPAARDPRTLLAGTGVPDTEVEGRWAPYYSLDPAIVAARASEILRPPAGVTLAVADGVLTASGPVPESWAAEAVQRAALIPGVTRFDAASALDAPVREIIAAVESTPVLFAKGSSQPAPGQRALVDGLVRRVRDLDRLAAVTGVRYRLDIVGHTDDDGAAESNVPLSRARAETVARAIDAAAVPHLRLDARGVGSDEPETAGRTEADNQRNRRVTVRVTRVSAE
jgi:OOP family OmpA-OmpF porin